MRPAVWAETVKLAGSTVGRVGSIAIVVGISLLSGAMLLAAASGDPQLVAKLGPAATRDWTGFLLAAAQITGAGGLLGFGVVLSWMFGREFGDGTITGLFALPVRRSTIALAKLTRLHGVGHHHQPLARRAAGDRGTGRGPRSPHGRNLVGSGASDRAHVMTAAIAAPVAWAATARALRARGRERLDRDRRHRAGLRPRRDRGMDAARIPSSVGDLLRGRRHQRPAAAGRPVLRSMRARHSERLADNAARSLTSRIGQEERCVSKRVSKSESQLRETSADVENSHRGKWRFLD